MPDTPFLSFVFWNLVSGQHALTNLPEHGLWPENVLHSFLTWATIGIASLWWIKEHHYCAARTAYVVGIYAHSIADAISHKNNEGEWDQRYFWPFWTKFRFWVAIMDYRPEHGLWPAPFELRLAAVLIMLLASVIMLRLTWKPEIIRLNITTQPQPATVLV